MATSFVPATYAFLLASLLTAGLIVLMRRSRLAGMSLDHPNHRSLHHQPTPRIGGIAMLLAVSACLLVWPHTGVPPAMLLLAGLLAVVSLLDDRSDLPILLRLATHIAAATLMVLVWVGTTTIAQGGGGRIAAWLLTAHGAVLLIIALCWMANLFNFMDGANGLAGGMAAIGFGTFAIAAALSPIPHIGITLVSAAIAGAACGFLLFNFPKARVFMGDAGSIPIGFLAAAIAVQGNLSRAWPWWFGLMIFSPFIVDATATIARRIAKGDKFWRAHREHYYQRLILSGWSHTKTVLSYYFLMLCSAISALISQNSELLYPIALFWVITYSLLIFSLEWRFHQKNNDKTKKHPGAT